MWQAEASEHSSVLIEDGWNAGNWGDQSRFYFMTVCAVHSHLHKVIIRESDFYDRKWTNSLVHPRLTVQINSKGDGES